MAFDLNIYSVHYLVHANRWFIAFNDGHIMFTSN